MICPQWQQVVCSVIVVNLLCKIVNGCALKRGGSSQQDSNDVIGIKSQFIIGDLLPSCPLVRSGQHGLSQECADDLRQNSADQAQQMVQHVFLSLHIFLDFHTDLQLAEYYFRDFFCKTEKEPEPVITEDLQVLALSLMNNTRFKSEK